MHTNPDLTVHIYIYIYIYIYRHQSPIAENKKRICPNTTYRVKHALVPVAQHLIMTWAPTGPEESTTCKANEEP